jgi:asparagine synthase (glutamine-hydrolysing)
MCGILGSVRSEQGDFDDAIATLSHRGPDDCGSLTFKLGYRRISLGHTRLSILDLSDQGHQPMSSTDDDCHLVYNGEIYNYHSLADQYNLKPLLKSRTDTEVLLHLLLRFGPESIPLLQGDFAFAVLMRESNKLYLVRDRLGVKPLYYSLADGDLYFGSELKVFDAMGCAILENHADLSSYFAFKYFPGEVTPFFGVKRLPPATYLEYDIQTGSAVIHTYWKPDYSSINPVPYGEAVQSLRAHLQAAVEDRLIADVPIGTFLSGGLDSSAIAYFLRERKDVEHHCAKKTQSDLKNEGTSSDAYFAERLSREWGLKTHYYDIGFDQADEDLISTTVYYGDDLIADGSQIPSYLITKNAATVSKVLLSGMGADELFLGYGGHLLTLLSSYMDRLPAFMRRMLSTRMASLHPGKGRGKGYKRFLVKLGRYESYGRNKYGLYSIVGDYERSCSVLRVGNDPMQYITPYFESTDDPFNALTRFEMDNFLVKNLHYFDRMCMANSVEGRVPFMDHRLVEFALSLPVEYKLSPFGNSKRILKDAMKGLLPEYILNRRKAGFGMPLRSVFSERRKLDGLLQIDYFGGMQDFNTDNIIALADEHIAGVNDNSSILYALVSYRIWRQRWIEN